MPRWAYFVIFMLIAAAVLAAIHWFLWMRLVRDPQLAPAGRAAATMAIVVLASSVPAIFILGPLLSPPWRGLLAWPVFTWLGVMFLLLVVLLGVDVGRLTVKAFASVVNTPVGAGQSLLAARVLAVGALAIVGVLSVLAVFNARSEPELRRIEVGVSGLPASMDETTILFMSDIHLGATLGQGFARQLVESANAVEPDIVAIAGDLVDYSVDLLRDDVAPLMALEARLGVFFVPGNHEYYAGIEPWVRELRRLGMEVLLNEHVAVGPAPGLVVAGVTDSAGASIPGHAPDLDAALEGTDPSAPVILLSHQPRMIAEAAEKGVALQLSGHTHHGQIWPFSFAVRLQQPYVRGLVRHGPTLLYTSPGTGYWGPPMRLGSRAEMTLVVLRAEGKL